MIFVGTDGYKNGWFAVKLTDNLEWAVEVFEDVDALWMEFNDALMIHMIFSRFDEGNKS